MRLAKLLPALFLFLTVLAPAGADPSKVVQLRYPETIKAGGEYEAVVVLDAPAPEGGSKVILFPSHRIKYPDTVIVPEGQTEASFTFEVFKAQIRDWHFDRDIAISTLFKGTIKEWPGPEVKL